MHVLGTCGHVDHGKSSLLRALTGMEPDRLPEEKKRGMTIDLNFVWMDLHGARVGIVDVPGHQRFVKNMISGTINVDAFLFIVAADDGWMPQSQEHLDILRSLGVDRGVGIVTKTDLVDTARVREVQADLAGKLEGALGKTFPILSFSTQEPETAGTVRRSVEVLVDSLPAARDIGVPRFWIDRVFLPKGVGIVATGTLRDGALCEGDEVHLFPSGKTAQIKSLQMYHQSVKKAEPVSRVAVGLGGVRAGEIERGVLVEKIPHSVLSMAADTRLRFFGKSVDRNTRVSFHVGTRRESAMMVPLGKPTSQGEVWARFKFANPLPLRAGDRFVLRTSGEDRTLGAGTVADPQGGTLTHAEAREALVAWGPDPKGTVAFEAKKNLFVDTESLSRRSPFTAKELEAASVAAGAFALGRGVFVEKPVWEKGAQAAKKCLGESHARKNEPVPEKDLRKAWGIASTIAVRHLSGFLDRLADRGEILKQGKGYLPSVSARSQDPAAAARTQQTRAWMVKGMGEPTGFRDAPAEIKKVARELVKAGEWVALGEEYFWDSPSFSRVRQKVESCLREKGQASTSDLKTILGLSRKIAVLILEQLDRDRLTYLKDGVRRLLKG